MTTQTSARRRNHSDGKTFVTEFAVEDFIGAVLPRLARIDQRRFDALGGKPLKDWDALRLSTTNSSSGLGSFWSMNF